MTMASTLKKDKPGAVQVIVLGAGLVWEGQLYYVWSRRHALHNPEAKIAPPMHPSLQSGHRNGDTQSLVLLLKAAPSNRLQSMGVPGFRNVDILHRCLKTASGYFRLGCAGSPGCHYTHIFTLRDCPLDLGHRVLL